MKDNALAVANYFVELAQKESKPITLLGLVKRVYIAHGFSLAIFHKSLLDPPLRQSGGLEIRASYSIRISFVQTVQGKSDHGKTS